MADDSRKSERRILPTAQMVGAGETRQLLSSLVHLASELNATLELPDLLDRVTHRALDVMNVEVADFYFLDSESGDLVREDGSPLLASGDGVSRLPVDAGILGHVFQTGTPYFSNDLASDPYFDRTHDRCAGGPLRNILCVPLRTQQEGLIGVARVANRRGGRDFDLDDAELYKAFADMATVSIANARLHGDAVERRKLEREMSVARDIQQSFLPAGFPVVPGLTFEATMRPAFHVGGDLYDVFPMKDGRACVVVGDVSGKGASAALYMACLHSELRLVSDYNPDPHHILHRLNEIMYNRSRRGAFITFLLALLDPMQHKATILSAGHPEPILFDPHTSTAALAPCRNGFPLGVVADQQYEAVEVDLPPGSVFLAYSDGVVEARNPAGEEFEYERLIAAFERTVREGREVVPTLQACLQNFAGDAEQYDDITMVAVHVAR